MRGGGLAAARGVTEERRAWLGAGASVVLLLTAFVLAVVGSSGGGGTDTGSLPVGSPQIATAADLESAARALGHPLYWAGSRPATELELTEEADGSVFLRYLPAGAKAGDARTSFLTVGTYPVADAQAALRTTAKEAGAPLGRLPDGSVTLQNPSSKGSVYLAAPGSDLEIEVYDPRPGVALRLIEAGAIEPVEG